MTKEEILSRCTWDEHDFATLAVFSRMLAEDAEVRFVPVFDSGRRLADGMVAALNDFLALTEADLETVKDFLWEDCKDCFLSIDYGVELLDGETPAQANHRDFGIQDREAAYRQASFKRVSIREEPELLSIYAALDFLPPWEREHGCSVVMKNGKLIARYSNDVNFGRYEGA